MNLHYIYIAFGGAAGAMMRVFLGELVPINIFGVVSSILFVNILGCFLIGIITEVGALYWQISDNMKYFIISGFLGGFTTFSSFVFEFGSMLEQSRYFNAFAYVFFSFLLSAFAFLLAIKMVRVVLA